MSSEESNPTEPETMFKFRLPDTAEGLTEAEIIAWHVEKGEEVEEADLLCEVETDKAVVEIPAPCDGRIETLHAEPGEIKQVGEVIAVIETTNPPNQQVIDADKDGSSSDPSRSLASQPSASEGESSNPPSRGSINGTTSERPEGAAVNDETDEGVAESGVDSPENSGDRIFAPPSTRRYARKQGVEISTIEGTGPNDRVLREDIDRQVDLGRVENKPHEPFQKSSRNRSTQSQEEHEKPIVRRELTGVEKTVATKMATAKQEIPHVSSGYEADAEEFVELKDRLNKKHEQHVTYTALIMKAVVPALKEFPSLNASIDMDEEVVSEKHYYDIGVATHSENGLLVPVIEGVDEKSLLEVASELEALSEAAREGSLSREELTGSTFTITNVGTTDVRGTFGTPIINYPETAILGVGQIRDKVVPTDENDIDVRKRLRLTLGFDHRLIDGMTARQFAGQIISSIEDPDILMSRL
jgi:pyruvate dehydrogenase E2 component (dihydrolipoamide acetyltransferase)